MFAYFSQIKFQEYAHKHPCSYHHLRHRTLQIQLKQCKQFLLKGSSKFREVKYTQSATGTQRIPNSDMVQEHSAIK